MTPSTDCTIDGCERPQHARGWCQMHHKRWLKHGDPLTVKLARSAEDRLRLYVQVGDNLDDCWPWLGHLSDDGYGKAGGKKKPAHRWVYEQLTGETVLAELQLDHLCRNPSCVNPDHLEPVTKRENQERGMAGFSGIRTRCRSGRHDITDPANVYTRPGTGVRECLTCRRERSRENARKYRAGRRAMQRA